MHSAVEARIFNPCCCSCDIFADTFDRADSTDVGSDWTETAGDWSIASNALTSSSSNAKLDCDTSHPNAIPSHYVSVVLYGEAGDKLRVHVGDHYAQVTIGDPNGVLALYTSGGTLLTQCRVNATASTNLTLKVWYGETQHTPSNDSQFAAQLDSGDVLRYNVSRSGNSVALGTGAVSSTVRFDNFTYERHWTPTDTTCKQSAPPCLITADDFTRANSSDIGGSWDERAGDWSISSNSLTVSSSNALAISQVRHPRGTGALTITCAISSTDTTDWLRVIVNYQDDDNYYFAEAQIGAFTASIKLFSRVGGTNTQLGTTYTAYFPTSSQLTVCLAQGLMTATVPGIKSAVAVVATPTSPRLAGVGTGTVGGTVTVDSVSITRGLTEDDPDCPACESTCDCCENPPADASYVVDLGSASLTDELCDACDTVLAGEYTLLWNGGCQWTYRALDICTASPCSGYTMKPDLYITLDMLTDTSVSPSKCFWRLKVFVSPGGDDTYGGDCDGQAQWASDASDDGIDCEAGPWTLEKTEECSGGGTCRGNGGWQFGAEKWTNICDGTMNSTITISRAT